MVMVMRQNLGVHRPLVAALGSDTSESACLDVFTSLVKSPYGYDLHLPDFDLIVAFDQGVNGASAPVIIFGSPYNQLLQKGPQLDLEPVALKDGYKISAERLTISTGDAGRKSLHSEVVGPNVWRELVKDTIDAASVDHWDSTRPFVVDRQLTIESTDGYDPSTPQTVTWSSNGPESAALEPLLILNDGSVLAALSHTQEGHPLLLLPSWTSNKRAWLRLAWQVWVGEGYLQTPGPPSGFEEPAWMTALERRIHQEIVAKQAELHEIKSKLNRDVAELTTRLEQAESTARTTHRRLLTESGELLVDAVREALATLEFGVTDMDALHSEKREDLRVVEAGTDWIALVEVKGYTKGGKANDFLSCVKYQRLFALEEKRTHNAFWYVVNAYLSHPPAVRKAPFESNQDAVRAFAEGSDGLVIPTTDLFQLIRDVEAGELSPEDARRCLREAKLTYIYEPFAPNDTTTPVRGT